MNNTKLFNKDFTLMIIGQIISLFGNSILRFSLSLYVLDQTGSAPLFATILSIAILPTIFFSPFGGVLADRVSRKHIMLILDFITGILIFTFSMLFQGRIPMVAIAFVMVSLSIIQTFYQPSVTASIPILCKEENLLQGNGLVVQVNALSNLLGPILAGVLYTMLPFHNLLWIAAGSFIISAVLECIMKIPFKKESISGSVIKLVKSDLLEGMHFILKENPVLCKILFIIAGLNLVLSCIMSVGLPVVSNIILKLSPNYYAWLQAGMGIGTIAGSLMVGYFHKHFNIRKSYILFYKLYVNPYGFCAHQS